MQIIKINPKNTKKQEIDLIVRYLKQGKVVVLPTDTVYGLSCLATSRAGVDRIRKIKKSDKEKTILVLIDKVALLKKYTKISKNKLEYLKKIWPSDAKISANRARPTTVILATKNLKLRPVMARDNSLAARLPNSEFLCKIISRIGVPLVSTSLNVSGQEIISDPNEIQSKFKTKPDLVVDVGKNKNKKHSRLIDIRDIGNIKIIRK